MLLSSTISEIPEGKTGISEFNSGCASRYTLAMVREAAKKKLEADIPQELHDQLKQWISDHKNGSMRQCTQAMAELWLSLPEELQALTLTCPRESVAFKEAVRCTVEIVCSRQSTNTIAASPKTRYAVAPDNDTSPTRKVAPPTRNKKKRRANG